MPSGLKITDLRVAVVTRAPMTCPLIRIDTNQEGLYGLGEVRDGASKTYALLLKSRLLGENPCDVDRLFRKIKQFGHHARRKDRGLRRYGHGPRPRRDRAAIAGADGAGLYLFEDGLRPVQPEES